MTQIPGTDDWGQAAAAEMDQWRQGGGDGTYADPSLDGGLGDLDVGDVQTGPVLIDRDGVYHLEVESAEVDAELNRNGRQQITVRCRALNSIPNQSPPGSIIYHRLEIPTAADRSNNTKNGGTWFEAVLQSLCRWLAGVGVVEHVKQQQPDGSIIAKYIDPETGSPKLRMATIPARLAHGNPARNGGVQFVGRLKGRSYVTSSGENRTAFEFSWGGGATRIDDPANIGLPLNDARAVAAGYQRAQPQAPTPPTPPAPPTPPQQQQAAPPQIFNVLPPPQQQAAPPTPAPAATAGDWSL
jgi:hypothetical protein